MTIPVKLSGVIPVEFQSTGKQDYKTQEKIPDFLRNRGFAGPSDEI